MSGIRESALGALCALVVGSAPVLISEPAFTAGETHAPIGEAVGCGASQAVPTEGKWGALITAYNGCGQQLFRAFAEKPGNIVLSPYSIGTAMAMALAGARGETASEMAKVLGLQFPREKIDGANADVLASLNGASSASFQLHVANALMLTKKAGAISDGYVADLKHNYAAEVFRGADLVAVNNWVKEKTDGKIDAILDQLDPMTALVLFDAIYFKASWQKAFDAAATRDEAFHLRNSEAKVPMMEVRGDFALADRPGYRAIRLPYAGGHVGMIIVLPNADAADAVQRLDGDELQFLLAALRAPARPVEISLPRFHASFAASLKELFAEIGMHRAFDMRKADFSGMTGKPQSEVPLAIDQIAHRAVIDVAEKGTEAAAVTGVVVLSRAEVQRPTETFRVDRPFIFAIVDDETGVVLFEGRITDPR